MRLENPTEIENRRIALKLAVELAVELAPVDTSTEEIVVRAEKLLRFLLGNEEKGGD